MTLAFDYILVGGGLQSGLIALALLARCAGVRLAVAERAGWLGGNHTWSFHDADVLTSIAPWLEPLVCARWPGYEVHFPGLSRRLDRPYATVSSRRLDELLRQRLSAAPGCSLFLHAAATELGAHAVRLADGRELTAAMVIDARGLDPGVVPARAAFQKFVGVEARIVSGDAPVLPVVMDARVAQSQGFHFVYVLPLASDRLLVEDTMFADNAQLDRTAMRDSALAYLERSSTRVVEILREESGVLPMPWSGRLPAIRDSPLAAGTRGGWFHPGTGYSFTLALQLAMLVADSAPSPPSSRALHALRRSTLGQMRFIRFLNWMLFRAIEPSERWRVLERFHRLPEDLIARYYALDLTLADRARILLHGGPWRHLRWPGAREEGTCDDG